MLKYLPIMAGIPLQNAEITENFLYDIRRTIADLISDNFFGTLKKLAHANGSDVQTESVPPGMMSDGPLVHKNVDVTAGEFWVTAWQNWKPCDIKEAASGAHIYGKQIAMAEAFTGGGDWSEHPYDLKAMGDMHFAEGINRMMIHLWAAQPYPGRLPGQTGAAGTFFNQHTPWIKPGKAWIDYLRRCQTLLQRGKTICDVAYFIGEDVPCRALIPPEYGSYFVTDPPLPKGYDFDSVNQDVLLNSASVRNRKIVLKSGASYEVLVLRPGTLMTPRMINKVKELVEEGAIIIGEKPVGSPSLEMRKSANEIINYVADQVWGNMDGKTITTKKYGNGHIFWGKSMGEVLAEIGVEPDLYFFNLIETKTGNLYKATSYEPHGVNPTLVGEDRKGWGLLWNHRVFEDTDYYFVSNQEQFEISGELSFRINGKIPEFWHPDTGIIEDAPVWREENGRTVVPYHFDPAGSVFVVFRKSMTKIDQIVSVQSNGKADPEIFKLEVSDSGVTAWSRKKGEWILTTKSGKVIPIHFENISAPLQIDGKWDVEFPLLNGEVKKVQMECKSWIDSSDEDIKYFSGTATYKKNVDIPSPMITKNQKIYLDLGDIKNLGTVKVNEKELGIVWKPPYRINITEAVKVGNNNIEVEIANTWKNRLIKDANLPEDERETWVLGSTPSADSPLIPAGLLGPVEIFIEQSVTC